MPHWQPGNSDLPTSGVTAGTYGDATHVAQVAVSAAGLVTAASNVGISGGGGATQFDYVEITSNVTVSSSNPAAPDDVIVGNSVTYDGTTRIKIEFYAPVVEVNHNSMAIDVWDGATDLGEIGGTFLSIAGVIDLPSYGCRFLTPAAGAHTFKIRASRGSTTTNSGLVAAGAGGAGNFVPAFMRITAA